MSGSHRFIFPTAPEASKRQAPPQAGSATRPATPQPPKPIIYPNLPYEPANPINGPQDRLPPARAVLDKVADRDSKLASCKPKAKPKASEPKADPNLAKPNLAKPNLAKPKAKSEVSNLIMPAADQSPYKSGPGNGNRSASGSNNNTTR